MTYKFIDNEVGAFPVCPQRTKGGPAGWLFDHDLARVL
jgi:hypothetical protein